MNGVLNILKPPGMTSQNVVSYVKRTLNANKAGHTGTLDPGAAGVLPVCIGKATRISEYLMNDRKRYRAEMRIGARSSTLDGYSPIESVDIPDIDGRDLHDAFERFKGTIEQVPPMFSALKHNGVKMYDLARRGVTVDRKPRSISIFELNIIDVRFPVIMFDVICSKGTYIRTLCSDIARSLGTDAVMTFLLRTATGPFDISDSITLDELSERAETGRIGEVILPMEFALRGWGRIYADRQISEAVRHGVGFALDSRVKTVKGDHNEAMLIFDPEGSFIAVGEASGDGRFISIDKVFA